MCLILSECYSHADEGSNRFMCHDYSFMLPDRTYICITHNSQTFTGKAKYTQEFAIVVLNPVMNL
jgi:ABC-type bacteriocin/lantibiotic exporter with double-glycine peptidase domain